MLRAPVAEKVRFVAVGAGAPGLDPGDTALLQLEGDKPRQIEMGPLIGIFADEKFFVVRATFEKLGARRDRIIAAVGPCINQDAYEVGPDFEATLLKSCADNSRFLARAEPNSKAHFDLPGFVVSQLDKLGLAQIERQSPCTYVNESQFFSFRRSQHRSEGDYGRQISAIVVT